MEKYYYARPLKMLCQNQGCELTFVSVKNSPIILLGLLLVVSEGASAMSLGRHRGAALIGRPLDMSIQAVLDGQEDPSSLCIEADVFYADNKLSQSRVQVSAERTVPGGQDVVVRVRSNVPINEPVVTVYLRSGCQQKNEKRYVMLADLVSDQASLPAQPMGSSSTAGAYAGAAMPRIDAAQGISAATPLRSGNGAFDSQLPSARGSRRSRARSTDGMGQPEDSATSPSAKRATAESETKNRAVSTTRRSQRMKEAKAAEKNASHLKLEPLDLTVDRDPQLRASTELLSTPSTSPQERSAAAALWRALTAQPQDILRDAERLQSLESSVKGLQAQSQKNRLQIDGLNGQVKQAQSERYANPLVYALGLLLLLALATLAYVARKGIQARGGVSDDLPWWRRKEPMETGWAGSAASSKESVVDIDLDLGENGSNFVDVKHLSGLSGLGNGDSLLPVSRSDRSDFGMSMSQPARAVKAEELFDVQQQADFFVSLGQHDQAIEVLRSHIGDNVQTSALVYLDLFNLYHQLNRQTDYEALREDFNQRFNAKIPAFEFYNDASSGLEAYQSALTRIEALWPSPKVLEVIEESLFRHLEAAGTETFSLEAYRELLMLYSVAREINSPGLTAVTPTKFDLPELPDEYDVKTSKFMSTSIQPLSATVVAEKRPIPQDPSLASVLPPASSSLGLDLDLSSFGTELESSSPEPESDSHFFAQFSRNAAFDRTASSRSMKLPATSVESDNLIDFDDVDSSLPEDDKTKPPKV
jgi:hypothetical protein